MIEFSFYSHWENFPMFPNNDVHFLDKISIAHNLLYLVFLFSLNRPLGRFGLVVAMSVRISSPPHAIVFEASHWPSDHMISSRPLIGKPK